MLRMYTEKIWRILKCRQKRQRRACELAEDVYGNMETDISTVMFIHAYKLILDGHNGCVRGWSVHENR